MPRPVKIIVFVLGEHADGLVLEAAVELSWRATEQSTPSNSPFAVACACVCVWVGGYARVCRFLN